MLAKDEVFGAVESVKAVSDLFSPVSGEVVESNRALADATETVNNDPFGEAWMVRIRLSDPSEINSLLDSGAYEKLAEEGAQ
jgi:glycine cleavage system H protein